MNKGLLRAAALFSTLAFGVSTSVFAVDLLSETAKGVEKAGKTVVSGVTVTTQKLMRGTENTFRGATTATGKAVQTTGQTAGGVVKETGETTGRVVDTTVTVPGKIVGGGGAGAQQ